MSRLHKALSSHLFTRFGILTLLLLSLAAVSFPQTQAAKACGTCWYAIGCECWTCSSSANTACTLNPGNNADCMSGGPCPPLND
jgi:hypothetical protein